MKDDGYVPFECPKAFDGYDELAQDAEERIRVKRDLRKNRNLMKIQSRYSYRLGKLRECAITICLHVYFICYLKATGMRNTALQGLTVRK